MSIDITQVPSDPLTLGFKGADHKALAEALERAFPDFAKLNQMLWRAEEEQREREGDVDGKAAHQRFVVEMDFALVWLVNDAEPHRDLARQRRQPQ